MPVLGDGLLGSTVAGAFEPNGSSDGVSHRLGHDPHVGTKSARVGVLKSDGMGLTPTTPTPES